MEIKRGQAFWEKLVREVRAGASQAAVARRYGVSASWLGRWCRRLGPGPATGLLLPVRLPDAEEVCRIEARVGGVIFSWSEGTDVAYVAALLRSVSA